MLSPLMLSSVVHLTKEDHFAFFAFDQAASWCKLNRSRNRLALFFVSRRVVVLGQSCLLLFVRFAGRMKASLGNRIRTIVLANFILCILIQFVWLAYASGHGMP